MMVSATSDALAKETAVAAVQTVQSNDARLSIPLLLDTTSWNLPGWNNDLCVSEDLEFPVKLTFRLDRSQYIVRRQ